MQAIIKTQDTRQPMLTRAVIRQIGDRDSLEDVARHGVDGGFSGFTSYADTIAFTKRHKTAILDRAKEDADSMGSDGIISFLASFGCLKGTTQEEIADGLYNPRSESRTTVFNALAWYACEEIARELNPDI